MGWIEHQWAKRNALTVLLTPLSGLFALLSGSRRWLYRRGLLQATRLPRPTIIVGNITAGGTGKTPLITWLCEFLKSHGYHPGIISRGYGGDGRLHAVTPDSDPRTVGDEPLLLARRCQVPVFVGPRRVEAGQALLAAYPHVDIVLCDDGLQHYGLIRDLELAVIDAARGFGNGLLLPAGPLRELPKRLLDVDAIVSNGGEPPQGISAYRMQLTGHQFVNIRTPQRTATAQAFRAKRIHAIAAIGNPPRFFAYLEQLGIKPVCTAFADHHAFTSADLAYAGDDIVLMTEKDAVKCDAFANPNWWYLPVHAEIDSALGDLILIKLKNLHGS